MVQLGLCAFRQGLIHDAWNCLQEIHATTRVKELLAQGIVNMRNQVCLDLCLTGAILILHVCIHVSIVSLFLLVRLHARHIVISSHPSPPALLLRVSYTRQESTPEQIVIQRRRQTPFHMHINIDMMECVYFACSMLIEIPAMAQPENPKRRYANHTRTFNENTHTPRMDGGVFVHLYLHHS